MNLRPFVHGWGLLLLLSALSTPSSSAAALDAATLTLPFAVSTSITEAPDSTRYGSRLRSHDDRVDPTLAPDVITRRRAQAFDAQCWAVAAPGAVVAGGLLVAVTASSAGRDDAAALGAGLMASGIVIGPAFGWARAGYWGRAAGSIGLRAGTLVGSLLVVGMIAGGKTTGETGLGVTAIGLGAGCAAVAIETVLDVRHLGRHVRAHGPASEARVAFLTTHGPGLAVTLPLH